MTPHAPHWLSPADGLEIELRQAADEGRDPSALAPRARATQALPRGDARREWDADQLYAALEALPAAADYPFCEPADAGTIAELRPPGPRRLPVRPDSDALARALHGAWLGRCAGSLLGRPVAGWRREQIVGFNFLGGNWPISDYMRLAHPGEIVEEYDLNKPAAAQPGAAGGAAGAPMPHPGAAPRGWLEQVDSAPAHSELDFALLALAVLEAHGSGFAPEQAAELWLARLPLLAAPAAERSAMRNLALGIAPPRCGTLRNPFREWTGARRAGALCGLVNPGWPERAAALALRFAQLAHTRNGLYDAMWIAAMTAAAHAERDIPALVRTGLSELPFHSRLNLAIHDVLGWRGQGLAAEQAAERLHARWDETNPHHRAHAVCNAQVVAFALLWGEGDFEQTLGLAVGMGFDTAGNAATLGTLLGLLHGPAGLAEKWTTPLRGRLRTNLIHAAELEIQSTATRCLPLALASFKEH